MNILFKGLMELAERLQEARKQMIRAAAQSVAVSAEEVVAMAKELCPVESGALRNSITATVSRTETGVTAQVTCKKGYGKYVEYGTSKMPARPFMYPAARAYEAKIKAQIAAAIRGVL